MPKGLGMALLGSSTTWSEQKVRSPLVSDDLCFKFKIEDTTYLVYNWIHVSRLKPHAIFPDGPTKEVAVSEEDEFDAALLSNGFSEPDEAHNIYKVEAIRDV
ncbi:hypothetical protein PHMEG_0007141 [Phytophthora megakarya]|uniref:Uncharacterized protein n=1 Tax=Phytophthora megakarya TaxID=4795 RepID=A0A225WP36_9STRA|nr:hypothetical protein PHMEG_0007141 [Phytophthora megakarya]